MPIDSRHLHTDDEAGIHTIFHYDEDTGDVTLEERQDVTDIVEHNKRVLLDAPSGWKGDLHRIASIPFSIFFDLKRRGIIDDKEDPKRKKLLKWLSDPENQVFRTKEGRLV